MSSIQCIEQGQFKKGLTFQKIVYDRVMENDLDTLYHLKPFEWEERLQPDYEYYDANTWGGYNVTRSREYGDDDVTWDQWVASYCFDEYCDEGCERFDTLEEAKEWCWENWKERILPCLIKTRI